MSRQYDSRGRYIHVLFYKYSKRLPRFHFLHAMHIHFQGPAPRFSDPFSSSNARVPVQYRQETEGPLQTKHLQYHFPAPQNHPLSNNRFRSLPYHWIGMPERSLRWGEKVNFPHIETRGLPDRKKESSVRQRLPVRRLS